MAELKNILACVRSDLNKIEKQLQEIISSKLPLLDTASKRLFEAGGKRLRPALVLLSAGSNKKYSKSSSKDILKWGVAVELLHTASLIHDDILDESDLRRSRKTINSRWGNKVAVIVGDYVYSKIIPILVTDASRSSRQDDIINVLSDVTSQMCEAEIKQLSGGNNSILLSKECLEIIKKKTAVLFSACSRIGALQAGHSAANVRSLTEYGLNFGMAFQMTDDVLDLTSTSRLTGKSNFSDIIQKKTTLLMTQTIAKANRTDTAKLRQLLRSENIKRIDVQVIKELMIKYGAIEYVMKKARVYARRARLNIDPLDKSKYKIAMEQLCDCVIERV